MGNTQLAFLIAALSLVAFLGLLAWHIRRQREWCKGLAEATQNREEEKEEILRALSLAMAVLDQKGAVLWHNPSFAKMVGGEAVLSGRISQYLPELGVRRHAWFPSWKASQLTVGGRIYRVESRELTAQGVSHTLMTFEDISESVNLDHRFQDDRPAVGLIQIDNFSEAFQGIDESKRAVILGIIDKAIGDWSVKIDSYLKKFAEDRSLLLITQGMVRECEKNRFDLLDRIREISSGNKIPITLSIGIGMGEETVADLARLAHFGLELALGRGGDQVVLKWPDRVLFYGGKSNTVEKKTKVRARVVANTLRQQIHQAEQVMVVSHTNSDMDSAGSALGIAAVALFFEKPVFLVLDNATGALDKLHDVIKDFPVYGALLLSGWEALNRMGEKTLLVVVDTHKPSLLVEPALVDKADGIILIDHHRRAEEFIDKAGLTYLEPYASSASELVAEILQYLGEEVVLDPFVASVLLAGIVVDTKNFLFQTGVRTFEAAGFLRRAGAEPKLIRRLLQDDFETVLERSKVVQNARVLFGQVALGNLAEGVAHSGIIAAQTADILLSVEKVKASFVLYPAADGVNISGRSNGEINVQLLMEKLGGGGHFTIAGAQLKGLTIQAAEEKLESLLRDYFQNEK